MVNQPKNTITINTKRTQYLRSVPQDSNTGGKINYNIYIHCSASADHGFGQLRTFLLCTIQVHPSARLLVDWICCGLCGGGWVAWVGEGHISTPYDFKHGRPEQRSTVHQVLSFGTSSTSVLLMDWVGLTVHQTFSVGNIYVLYIRINLSRAPFPSLCLAFQPPLILRSTIIFVNMFQKINLNGNNSAS